MKDKKTGQIFSGFHFFEDSGEAGHAWRHIPPAFDKIITTQNASCEVELLKASPFLARFAVTYTMEIPVRLREGEGDYIRRLDGDGDDARRSQETRELKIRSEFTLTTYSRGLAVKTTFNNTCEDHRLRVMFPTGLKASYSCAEEPFDVVERVIDRDSKNPWYNTWNPTHPHQRFVDVSDGKMGLAIINDGLREYEVTDDSHRTIGLTLMRAFEVALTTVAWRWERHPEMKGSQSLGEHEINYLLYPHSGDWDQGGVVHQADTFNVPVELVQAGPHSGKLPKSLSFMEIKPQDLHLSSLKHAEDRDSIIVRVYNPTKRDISGHIKSFKKPKSVTYVNLNEEPLTVPNPKLIEDEISFSAKAKKIITMEIIF
jgi:alpha-mannosidase